MIGSGFFCDPADGAEIGIDGSDYTVKYTLQYDDGSGKLNWAEAVGGSAGDTIVFGQFTDIGAYTVVAITDKGCTSSMNGEVITVQKTAPQVYSVLSEDTAYCGSTTGVEMWMEHSEADVVYAVFDASNNLVTEVTGDGTDSLSLGLFTQGTYNIIGAYGGDACETDMNNGDAIVITELPAPVKFNVSADKNNVCGSTGALISLDGSEDGREYVIYEDAVAGDTITGTGDPISWYVTSFQGDTISYEVMALSSGRCDASMGTTQVIYKNSPAEFNVIAKDSINEYCAGETGIIAGLDSSELNIGYQLLDDALNIVDFAVGTGDTLYFINPHTAGQYMVKAIDFNSGCSVVMSDTLTVVENPMPIVYNFCCTGFVNSEELVLDGSETGVTYSLLVNDTALVPPVDSVGTGNMINYGTRPLAGVYSVLATATGGCSALMNGEAVLYKSPLIAVNDIFSLYKGELIGEFNVAENDILLPGIDSLEGPDKNIYFKLDTAWNYFDENGDAHEFSTIGEVSINDQGKLEYKKLPSFYGRDSVRYIIYNAEHPERIDTATVFIFVGNVDLGDGRSFLIPNAFSPNGDNINDRFVITGIEYKVESKLEVCNRWGTLVYRSKGQNYDNKWDGKSTESNMVSAGDELPNGTYFYVFSVKLNVEGEVITKEYSGYIELRR
jgi:gliding motility-associated-like protein